MCFRISNVVLLNVRFSYFIVYFISVSLSQKDGLIVTEIDKKGEPTQLDFVDDYICQLLGYTKQELEHHDMATLMVDEVEAKDEMAKEHL